MLQENNKNNMINIQHKGDPTHAQMASPRNKTETVRQKNIKYLTEEIKIKISAYILKGYTVCQAKLP